jgi:hypothetical protein
MRRARDPQARFSSSIKNTQNNNNAGQLFKGEGSRNTNYQSLTTISLEKRKIKTPVLELVQLVGPTIEEKYLFPIEYPSNTEGDYIENLDIEFDPNHILDPT